MKDRAGMPSIKDQSLLPSYHQHDPNHHHDHRFNKKQNGGGDGMWKDLPAMRGAEINLLANSLSTRLRKAAYCRVPTSATGTTTISKSSGVRSAPVVNSEKKSGKPSSRKDAPSPPARPSILKRTLSRDAADPRYRQLLEQAPRSCSPVDAFHLPNVYNNSHLSSSTGHLDQLGYEPETFNNQYLDRPSPVVALLGGGGGGGGGGGVGGGGGGGFTRSHGQVMWVKRAGIFQPADKYAPGRQSLYGDDQPYSRTNTVDYETLTLPSRPESVDSDSDLSDWSGSSRVMRKKGLKVSWKHPDVTDSPPDQARVNGQHVSSASSSLRQRSASTVQSEGAAFAFSKPKFHAGKSRVPVVGVKWNVPTPKVGGPPQTNGSAADVVKPSSSDSTATPFQAASSTAHHPFSQPGHLPPTPGKPGSNPRDPLHPWRALYPRDVHPVTTAMEREGTSVSKTKWKVPHVRRVPAYTFVEDLMDSRSPQWNLAAPKPRHTTRATVDAHSIQARTVGEVPVCSNVTATTHTPTTTTTISNGTDVQPESLSQS